MGTFDLHKDVKFNQKIVQAQSLHSNDEGRALRFAFLPEQLIENYGATHSPVHLVVLQGRGMFTGTDGIERECGAGTMVVF